MNETICGSVLHPELCRCADKASSNAECEIKAVFKWIPENACGTHFYALSDHPEAAYASGEIGTYIIRDARKFDTKEMCEQWCLENSREVEWVPTQHGFAVKFSDTPSTKARIPTKKTYELKSDSAHYCCDDAVLALEAMARSGGKWEISIVERTEAGYIAIGATMDSGRFFKPELFK